MNNLEQMLLLKAIKESNLKPQTKSFLALEQKLNNSLAENRKYQKRLALIQRARVTEELID